MGEPMASVRGLEPDPIPSDLPANAPIINDIERGYPKHQQEQEQDEKNVRGEETRRASDAEDKKGAKAHGKGLTAGDEEMDAIPENNLWLVMPSICLVLFLAALDMTIVATALPKIAEELHATPSEYSWVGTSYTLAMTLLAPVNGRLSDIVGRKPILYAAILIFTIFSALCGAAKNMTWLITCRAFQGLGGGTIIGMSNIVVADITPLKTRGAWQGFIGGTWGIASVLGPILGGLLTDRVTWRWTFFINLPTAGAAFLFLLFSLKLNPTRKLTFAQFRATFDFIGLALLMIAGSLLIVGFSEAADYGFSTPRAYAVIIAGAVTFAVAIVHFLTTKRIAIIPARMFKNRTTLLFLIASTLHAIAFLPSNYLLPQLFQGVRGDDALQSGIDLLPFACCVSWATVVAGLINSKLRIVRPVAWVGYGTAAIGSGLYYAYYRYPIPYALQEGLQVITGVGVGLSLAVSILIVQAAMPLKEMAAATSAWSLTRALGGSIGLAIFTAILNSGLRNRFEQIPGYGTEFEVPTSAAGYRALHDLPDGETKTAVLSAFADSLGLCWIINCAFFITCLVITLPTRAYSLSRTGGKKGTASAEDPVPEEKEATPVEVGSRAASERTVVELPVRGGEGDERDK